MEPSTFFEIIQQKNSKVKKFQICEQNHRLTPLEKCKFCNFLISMILLSTEAIFLSRSRWTTFSINLANKSQGEEISNFWSKPWSNPFGKMQILQTSYINNFLVQKVIFLSECRRSLSFFTLVEKSHCYVISNFWSQPWTNPFGKMQILQLSNIIVSVI